MTLANLTTSGWVLFALTLGSWIGLLAHFVKLARSGRASKDMPVSVTVSAILTVWLLWLVTP